MIIDGIVYSYGGSDGNGTFFGLASYNPSTLLNFLKQTETNVWNPAVETKGPQPMSRTNMALTGLGKKIYLHGGNKNVDKVYSIMSDMFCYDTETNTWTDLGPLMKGTVPGQIIGMAYLDRLT